MKIELHQIPIRELLEGYEDKEYYGVSTKWTGKELGKESNAVGLNIRPPYQREFIYPAEKQQSVINTVRHGYPLNVMYWVKNKDGSFEVLDGQQRLLSILHFIAGNGKDAGSYTTFTFKEFDEPDFMGFDSLSENQQDQILSYPLQIYFCEGNDDEKLRWFKTINFAGERLRQQELLNAFHTGEWLTSAKSYFSRKGSGAANYTTGKRAFIKGEADRQDLLELGLTWIADQQEIKLEKYMSKHDGDANANELKQYFQNVMTWVEDTFDTQHYYRKEMKGLPWGIFYNKYYEKTKSWDSKIIEAEISKLMADSDVTKKTGIYEYILAGNIEAGEFIPDNDFENKLNIRTFDDKIKREVYEKQKGICIKCGKYFDIKEMEADHIEPWHSGGKTIADNCQMLCKHCNRIKSGK